MIGLEGDQLYLSIKTPRRVVSRTRCCCEIQSMRKSRPTCAGLGRRGGPNVCRGFPVPDSGSSWLLSSACWPTESLYVTCKLRNGRRRSQAKIATVLCRYLLKRLQANSFPGGAAINNIYATGVHSRDENERQKDTIFYTRSCFPLPPDIFISESFVFSEISNDNFPSIVCQNSSAIFPLEWNFRTLETYPTDLFFWNLINILAQ